MRTLLYNKRKFGSKVDGKSLPLTPYPLSTCAGFILFYALLIASLLLAVALAIVNITFKELVLSSGARESANAFYAADTGLECALYWDLKHESLSSPAFGFYGDSLASGLLAYWRFEDGTGSAIAVDSSGGGNLGTLTDMDPDTAWGTGRIGGALNFDGANDYVDVAPIDLTGAFTISLWYNVTNDGAAARMIAGGGPSDTPSAGRKFGFINSGGTFLFFVRVIDGGAADTRSAIPGGWHHLTIRRNASNRVDLIVNNGAAQTLFGGAPQSGTFRIHDIGGNVPQNGNQMYLGGLDDVRIYNRALSTTEVQRIFSRRSNPQFVQPVERGSNARCVGADITDPATGWDAVSGWDVATSTRSATTTFDLLFENGRCATVQVAKNLTNTTIVSRGYNSCNLSDPRRVERAIRATY